MQTMTKDEFINTAIERFGDDRDNWKFICPRCKTAQSIADFKEANIDDFDKYIGFSCIGRFDESKGCDWTLGGLFLIHELEVIDGEDKHPLFKLAETV